MVFSSLPVYPNWQEDVNQDTGGGGENYPLQIPPPLPGGGSSNGSIRPGSMAERARLAKIPQPEAALKCPRCESTNTKFCYFNNYSLSQPRHFCKTCRRYWTRGGALRNVPVGGGCRRNKRSKGSNRSKSPVKAGSSPSSGLTSNGCSTEIIGHIPPQLPILPPLHHLGEYNSGGMGLSFAGIQPLMPVTSAKFHIGSTSSSVGVDQWRLQVQQQVQQFPFLANLDQSSGLYSSESEGVAGQFRSKPLDSAVAHPSPFKTEEKEGINLWRNFGGNDQYWSGNAWSDLPSSSASHLL